MGHRSRNGGWRIAGRALLVLPFLLLCGMAFGQIDDDDDFATSAESSAIRDSLGQDSIAPQKEVAIRTEWFDLQAWKRARAPRVDAGFDLRDLMYFDRVEALPGYAVTLGQIGKPYKRYRYGLDASLMRTGVNLNPYTGQEDVYMLDPLKNVQFFDTRTPFINIFYGQGKSDLSGLEVDVSQNINPWWNISFMFRRDKSEGTYAEFATNHLDLYAATNYRSKNGRYQIFINTLFEEHNDAINGGVAQEFNFEDLFNKGSQPVSLSGANLEKITRSFSVQHMYQFVRDTTKSPHRLVVYNEFSRDYFENEYSDEAIDPTVFIYPYPLYPTLFENVDFVYEVYQHRRWRANGGATYRFVKPAFESGHHLALVNEFRNFEKKRREYSLNQVTTSYNGDIALKPLPFELKAELDLDVTTSNLFPAAAFTEGRASFSFPRAIVDYSHWRELDKKPGQEKPDSVLVRTMRRPFTAFASAMLHDRNPTVQQAFGDGWFGNGFRGDPNLGNQRIELLKLGMRLKGKDRKSEYGVLRGSHIEVTGFRSRQYAMIYFDTTMVLQQAPRETFLEFFGFEGNGRLRMKSFSIEGNMTYQYPAVAGANSDFLETYLRLNQPYLYGKVGIYWEKHDLKIARAIRAGIEMRFHADFDEPLFDGASQQFYPQNRFLQGGFQRVDAFFSAQVKKAQLYLRFYNTTEGLGVPGYMPTVFYPMWDRNLMVGVNWSFYD